MKNKFQLQNGIKHVHFIGIGGISMSGLAEILQRDGYTVSGSDWFASDITRQLSEKGIEIMLGNDAAHITDDIDLIVYTVAVKPNNPEFMAAQAKKIPCIDRASLLGIIMKGYEYSIAVAGVHGKTSTTAIISEMLLAAKLDPTISIGGFMESIGSNFRIGDSPYMVLEANEYYDDFLRFFPHVGIILNIDADHLDYFVTFERLVDSFRLFAQNIPSDGALIIHKDSQCFDEIVTGLTCRVITYADEDSFWARDVRYDENGLPSFYIMQAEKEITHIKLKLRGKHNIDNALAAAAVASFYGIPADGISQASGTKRRFEHKGMWGAVSIVDDYAHHPTEVKAALSAAANGASKRIVCAFQPHMYSRTQSLLDEFSAAFEQADVILILPVYAAREVATGPDPNYLVKQLTKGINNHGKEAYFFDSFEAAALWLKNNCRDGDLLITMGAGDINVLGEGLISGAY